MRSVAYALLALLAITGSASAADNSIAGYLAKTKSLSSLNEAVKAAGLDSLLSGKQAFTLLAPNNEAFAKITPEGRSALQSPESAKTLLRYHILPGCWKE